MGSVYDLALNFKRKHPGGIAWRLKKHCEVVEKHLNPGEKVLFAFAGQKNTKFYEPFFSCVVVLTNKRILIGQKRVVWGYFLSSITLYFLIIDLIPIFINSFIKLLAKSLTKSTVCNKIITHYVRL